MDEIGKKHYILAKNSNILKILAFREKHFHGNGLFGVGANRAPFPPRMPDLKVS